MQFSNLLFGGNYKNNYSYVSSINFIFVLLILFISLLLYLLFSNKLSM